MPKKVNTKNKPRKGFESTMADRLRVGSNVAFFHLAFYFILLVLLAWVFTEALDFGKFGVLYHGGDTIGYGSTLLLLNGTLLAFAILVPAVTIQVLGSDFRAFSTDAFLKSLYVRFFFIIFTVSLLLDLLTATGLFITWSNGVYQEVLADLDTALSASGILLIPAYFWNILGLQQPSHLAAELASHIPKDFGKLQQNKSRPDMELQGVTSVIQKLVDASDITSLDTAIYVPSAVYETWLKGAKKEKSSEIRSKRYRDITGVLLRVLNTLLKRATRTQDPDVFEPIAFAGEALWHAGYELIPSERDALTFFPAAIAGYCVRLKPVGQWGRAYVATLHSIQIMSHYALESKDLETFAYLQDYISQLIPEMSGDSEEIPNALDDSLNWIVLECLEMERSSDKQNFLNVILSVIVRSVDTSLRNEENKLASVLVERFVKITAHTLGEVSPTDGSIGIVGVILSRVKDLKIVLQSRGWTSLESIVSEVRSKGASGSDTVYPIISVSPSIISATASQLTMLEEACKSLSLRVDDSQVD